MHEKLDVSNEVAPLSVKILLWLLDLNSWVDPN